MDRNFRACRSAPVATSVVALACALLPSLASAEVNTIREVKARAEGARTIVVVRGDVTPSFTVYRLEQPSRLVLDVAGGQLGGAAAAGAGAPGGGPMEVDSWAVGQIAFAQYASAATHTVRVMIGLKRPASYDVKTRGNELIVSIIPDEAPAANADKARSADAEAAAAAHRARLAEEKRRADAEAARTDAEQRARVAQDRSVTEEQRRQVAASAAAAEEHNARLAAAARTAEEHKTRLAAATRTAEEQRARMAAAARAAEEQKARMATAARAAEEQKAQMATAARAAEEQKARMATAARAAEEQKAQMAAARRTAEELRLQEAETERQRAEAAATRAQTARDRAGADMERLAAERAVAERELLSASAERTASANRELAGRQARLAEVERQHGEAARRAQAEETALQTRLDAVRAETQEKVARASAEEQRKLEAMRAERDRLAAETAHIADLRGREAAQREQARQRTPIVTAPAAAAAPAVRPVPAATAAATAAPTAAPKTPVAPAARQEAAVAAATPRKPPAAAPLARVTSVDFKDEPRVARVVIGLSGDTDFTVLKVPVVLGATAGERTAVLRLRATSLPPQLSRTLDTSAFGGPVAAISTYADPDDPGAVRVVVKLGAAVEPEARKERGRIVWDFPKATLTGSFEAPRMAGYGLNTLPLQVGEPPAPSQLLGGGGGGRSGPGRLVGPVRHRFNGQRVNLDFKDADIHNLLRLLADVGNVNIVTSDDVRGTVTIRMRDTPWDQALDVILRTKGLGQIREGNLIRVAPQAVLEREREAEVAQTKIIKELLPLETRLVPLSYATADKVLPRVQDLLSPRGKVSVDERTNTLIMTDIAGNLALARELISNLDTQTPQVLIEARIVEARTNFLRDIGVQWGGSGIASAANNNPTGLVFPSTIGVGGGSNDQLTRGDGLQNGQALSPNYVVNLPAAVGTGAGGALGLTFGSVAGAVNVNLRLSAAESTGNVRILSAPKITTLDNVQASIEQGTSIPISVVSAAGVNTVFIDAKLNLTVKPHVTHEGSIVMNLEITRNEPDFSRTGARGDPTILKKQARTEMLVRDGDTAVIGGIYSRNTATNYAKIPWLGDIPILGWLFKQRKETDDRSELLIFITPRIVNRAASINPR